MQIKLKELKLTNFKSHRDLQVNFGEVTKISGDNEKGKSSILEAVPYTLYGLDMLGSKQDPTPTTYKADETLAELLLEVDGKQVKLARGLKKGKAQYFLNDVPSKATDFNLIVDELGEKEFILSLLSPFHFFSMHWEKQRSMVLQYVTAPSNKEVFKQLPDLQADKLSELVKKHSLDDLKKIHSANKTKMEKAHIAAESKTKTLQEQLERIGELEGDLKSLSEDEIKLKDAIAEADKLPAEAFKKNQEYSNVKSQIAMAQDQINASKNRWPSLKNEVIESACKTCKRPLDDESVKSVEADKDKRIAEYKSAHQKLVDRKKELQEKLDGMELIDATEEQNKVRQLEYARDVIINTIRKHKQREELITQIEDASKDEEYKLASFKESTFIIDAIKDFNAKEAEMQGEKAKELFKPLSVSLFVEQRNGEQKPTFEVEMEGKGYSKLSYSGSIRAGLEVREFLSKQSEVIAPVLIDNGESITKFKEPSGQLILSRVVAGQELKIEGENKGE